MAPIDIQAAVTTARLLLRELCSSSRPLEAGRSPFTIRPLLGRRHQHQHQRAGRPASSFVSARRIESRQGDQSWQYWHSQKQRSQGGSNGARPFGINSQILALVPLALSPIIRLEGDESQQHASTSSLSKSSDVAPVGESSDNDLDLLEEDHPGFFTRIWISLNRYIFESIGTTRRFLYLLILFLPVIFTAPVLALELLDGDAATPGSRRNRRQAERGTTRWWYRFLVKQMERAGPTFIKVIASNEKHFQQSSFIRRVFFKSDLTLCTPIRNR